MHPQLWNASRQAWAESWSGNTAAASAPRLHQPRVSKKTASPLTYIRDAAPICRDPSHFVAVSIGRGSDDHFNVFTGPHPIGKFIHTKHCIVQLFIRIITLASLFLACMLFASALLPGAAAASAHIVYSSVSKSSAVFYSRGSLANIVQCRRLVLFAGAQATIV